MKREIPPLDLSRYTVARRVLVGGNGWPSIAQAQRHGLVSIKLDHNATLATVVVTERGAMRLAEGVTG